VEVSDFSRLPTECSRLRIPEPRYEAFAHGEHIAAIRRTWFTIWNTWLPASGHQLDEAPEFGRYGTNSTRAPAPAGSKFGFRSNRSGGCDWRAAPQAPRKRETPIRPRGSGLPDLDLLPTVPALP